MNPLFKLPDVVTQLTYLEELFLNDCDLGFIPANLGRLSRLKVLEVRANHLATLPASLARFSNLVRLDIGQNELLCLPPVVRHLSELRELWCDFNSMSTCDDLSQMKFLHHLEAGDNLLKKFPAGLHFCDQLVNVTLSCNHIKEIPAEIGSLKSLVTLKLDINELTSLPSTIGQLSNLEELHLSENYLKSLPPSIGYLRKLIILHLDSNYLKQIPQEIGSCIQLRILGLQDNKLKSIPPEIGHLANLRVLSLAKNNLSYLPLSIFKLKRLKSLWLSFNQGMPLTPLCKMYDAETRSHYATNYLLPQKLMSPDTNDEETDSYKSKDKGRQPFIKFSANVNSAERNSGFTRVPTPYPRRLKKASRSPKEETEAQVILKNEKKENVPDRTSSSIRTAVVRRPAVSSEGEDDYVSITLHKTSKELSDLLSKGNKEERAITRSVNDLLLTDLFRPISNTDSADLSVGEDKPAISIRNSENTSIVPSRTPSLRNESCISDNTKIQVINDCKSYSFRDNFDVMEIHLSSVSQESTDTAKCVSDPEDGRNGKFWASVAMCTPRSQSVDSASAWTFGRHRNATVIEVVVERGPEGIGFTATVNNDILQLQPTSCIDATKDLWEAETEIFSN
ncbi:leucine-rich repeat-containing protein 7 isoform X2 [Nilaparvata lugens]|uniref:leucine-rich repeat-containing protein 7 isoform X2 n=1 Tax=Nilaparvata lugens TaxID=108931 RepID=UPI00193D809D|nr:leucine-rich repeat-containing protein 7 isoform X2 [Nilaparvata lugens]